MQPSCTPQHHACQKHVRPHPPLCLSKAWPAQQLVFLRQPVGSSATNGSHKHRCVAAAAPMREYSSNLGVLQPVVEQSVGPAEDPYAMQRVSVDSFSSRGYYLDGSAIFGSLVLLVLLLALTFERILGLDRFVNQALQRWKDDRQNKRRDEIINARQALEESWDGDDPKA